MNERYLDVYTLFKMQCADGDILRAYYPFLANIILDAKMDKIDENIVKNAFEEKYEIPITIPFIRQILGVGIDNGSIVKRFGEYSPNLNELNKYRIPSSDFDIMWKRFKTEFDNFCRSNNLETVSNETFENLVFSLIDTHSLKFIIDNDWSGDETVENLEYYWFTFVRELPNIKQDVFDFLAYLSASNTYREALFVSQQQEIKFENLNIYLDSPMVFALLGMDSPERCNAYCDLVKDIQDTGCSVQILDNNFVEVQGILERAGVWASSSAYDISKANKVAKFFHDSAMSRADMIEYSECLESKLNELGIVVKKTSYDILANSFQEDEITLCEMVREKYLAHNMTLSQEKEESINCDVKSIIMIYRERRGRVSTKIQSCSELMLTLNAALANVCKTYEQTKSISSGHIPACISADLFGSILWLNSPMESVEYQKKKILADCYSALRPNKELLKKYVESVDAAWKIGEIDENRYLFLRAHAVVSDALMNVTKGDYVRFNDHTYVEVYEEIEAIARKEYCDEKVAHNATKQELTEAKISKENTEKELYKLEQEFTEYKKEQEKKEQEQFDKRCHNWANILSIIICAIPYFLFYVLAEFLKAKVTTIITVKNVIIIAGLAILTVLLAFVKKKLLNVLERIMHSILKAK